MFIIHRRYPNQNNEEEDLQMKMQYRIASSSVVTDENQINEAFINEGRGHPPSHLKFFLLVFSKLKEDIK